MTVCATPCKPCKDGKPDLAISASTDVSVFLGNGAGTFTSTATSPMRVPSPPYDDFVSLYTGPIAVGDFNHGGHMGLTIEEFQNNAAVVLLGNGDGTFVSSSAAFANALGMPTSAIGTGDFNADGNLDLAITNEFSGQSPVALGYGSGAFSEASSVFEKVVNCPQQMCNAPSLASNDAQDRMFIDSSEDCSMSLLSVGRSA